MIKLKDIIKEIKDQYGERRPTISKVEENEAFNLITKYLLPELIQRLNTVVNQWGIQQFKVEDVRKFLKKRRIENNLNGQEILYTLKLPNVNIGALEFRIRKFAFRKECHDRTNTNTFDVGFYDITNSKWGGLAWVDYPVEEFDKFFKVDPDMI